MFRTFVVPLDGSSLAERAVPYAIRLAQAGRGRLILARAVLAPPPRTLDGSDWESAQNQAIDEAEAYLRGMAQSICDQAEVETIAPYGHAAGQIVDTARHFTADAIVMATHGRTGLPHLLYGSVTEAVLATSDVPVFVVYARPAQPAPTAFAPYTARIVVPQDGSANDPAVLHAAIEMLGLRGEMILVTVVAPPDHVKRDEHGNVVAYLDQQEAALRLQARKFLDNIADGLRARPLPINVKTDVRIGDPASGIAMAAIDHSADLIVMATHGRTGLRRAFLGSVAGTVLRSSPTPVVLVHPQSSPPRAHAEPVDAPAAFVTF